ncbi:MAG: methyltransferase domain-containing protein [Bacillota bacterium]|nr:methyltransferase domain-containing protein [Bacillota bacterium]
MADWDSNRYLMFENERTQPSVDLVNRILIKDPQKIVDIGCGPGNSTAALKNKFNDAYILGIDSSKNMIETSKLEYPNLDFKICDAENDLRSLGSDFDIVFSNACIQWIPNHDKLLRDMMAILKPGGILAVQTPMNYDEPIHQLIGDVTTSKKWHDCFDHKQIFFNLTPSKYFDLLSEISAQFTLWNTTYFHTLQSHEDIYKWYSSTGLRPYLNVLDGEKKLEFEKDILSAIKKRYPLQKNGKVIFRFPRFFFIAQK